MMNENYNTPNSGCCGRPMHYDATPKCNYNDCCMNEYAYKQKACIRNKQPDCEAQAVIPSITVETVDGITNLANCLVHVTSTNTTYYVDDKHRIMITWAGPVNIPGYDMEGNPNHYKDQIVTDTESGAAVIYDNHGNGFTFGIQQGLDLQEEVNKKIDEMAEDGTLAEILVTYFQPTIDSQNEKIAQQDNKIAQLELEDSSINNRIDNIVALPDGSTTADAELVDIRTGFNGFNFDSAGAAVRNEDDFNNELISKVNKLSNIVNVNFEMGAINTSTGEGYDSDYHVRTVEMLDSSDYIYITFLDDAYRGTIVWYNSDGTIATDPTTTSFYSNMYVPRTHPKFKLVLRPIADGVPADVHTSNAIMLTYRPPQATEFNLTDSIYIDFDNTEHKIRVKSGGDFLITRSSFITFNNKNYEIDYPSTTGTTYALYYNTVTDAVESINVQQFNNSNHWILAIYALPSNNKVISRRVFSTVKNISIDSVSIDTMYHSVGILGDSYSTFKDFILPDDRPYYPLANPSNNNVQEVEQTYWYKLVTSLKSTLLINDSFGGSTVALTIRPNHTYEDSFIRRMENSFGKGRNGQARPELILICGGTNDYWNNVPLGTLQYSGWTEDDLKNFLPAFCYMLDYIKKYNPGAKIVNIINDVLSSDFRNGMVNAGNHYGIMNVSLSNISKMSNHPDIDGMQSIYRQVLDALMLR